MRATGLCFECADRELAGNPSRLAVAAGVIGAGSLVCGFAPGLIGVLLGTWELRRIKDGRSSTAGVGWAQAGQVLGAVALLLGALLAFTFFG